MSFFFIVAIYIVTVDCYNKNIISLLGWKKKIVVRVF
jgi:hypothetical protein